MIPNPSKAFEFLFEYTEFKPRVLSPAEQFYGDIKTTPQDFIVEEIPLYPFLGRGEHLMLYVQKEDLEANAMLSTLAKHFKIRQEDIGFAGMKDRKAVTSQWVSLPFRQTGLPSPEAAIGPVNEQLTILKATLHETKLRTGHLAGNHFTIRIANPSNTPTVASPTTEPATESPLETASELRSDRGHEVPNNDLSELYNKAVKGLQKLQQLGLPNAYGTQRFGNQGNTLRIGLELLNGNKKHLPRSKAHARRLSKLAVNSVQSSIFNAVLAKRMADGTVRTVLMGDRVEWIHEQRFLLVDSEEDLLEAQEAVTAFRAIITGPILGPRHPRAMHAAGQVEESVLSPFQITEESFAPAGKLAKGTRRPFLILVADPVVTLEASSLLVSFTLPKGTYATVVLNELLRSPAP